MKIFRELESSVRSYIRSFPMVFDKAANDEVWDDQGNRYIDFFAGAGTNNYGHNPDCVSESLISYLQERRIIHSLDKATVAKREFLETFRGNILEPRNMDYKIQFTGPTGTNSVESALKLARMVKQRSNIVSFTNGYHGLTLGALAVTGNDYYRDESFGHRTNTAHMPYDGFLGKDVDTIEVFRKYLNESSSGVDLPAAVIVETIQGEGGINVARYEWLRNLQELCRSHDIILIVDDIQVGNGRTGTFFSFEEAGIEPDMICMSKALGGGIPFAILLMKPELDQWKPGEHTGTFRGNNLAFVASAELIKKYWSDNEFTAVVRAKGEILKKGIQSIVDDFSPFAKTFRGRGMVWGLEFEKEKDHAAEVSHTCFENGLIAELCGSENHVLKLLPPLTSTEAHLKEGLGILRNAVEKVRNSAK